MKKLKLKSARKSISVFNASIHNSLNSSIKRFVKHPIRNSFINSDFILVVWFSIDNDLWEERFGK